MNNENELAIIEQSQAELATTPEPANNKSLPDAKQLRIAHVGKLLDSAYQGASTLKLKPNEIKDLTEPFPDEEVEIRSFDGIIFISHMVLRERLWKVFGPTEVAEICRERMVRTDTNEIAVDLVLMARGKFLAEAIGTAKWYPTNAKTSFGDTIESAWSDALRRCCKRIFVGTQVWRPDYVRRWIADNAVEKGGKWYRKDDTRIAAVPQRKTKDYTLKGPSHFQAMKEAVQGVPEKDEDGDDIPF